MSPSAKSFLAVAVAIFCLAGTGSAANFRQSFFAGGHKGLLMGCFSDPASSRLLSVHLPGSNSNNPNDCGARCWALGYQLAGVSRGRDCSCGTYLGAKYFNSLPLGQCKGTLCAGEPGLHCGSSTRALVYHVCKN